MSTVTGKTWHEFEIEYSFTHEPAEKQTREHPGADAEIVDTELWITLNGIRISITDKDPAFQTIEDYVVEEYIAQCAEEHATKDDER